MGQKPARLGLVLLALLCACAVRTADLLPPGPGEPEVPIHVVAHGWHTGIAVRLSDVLRGIWPEAFEFAGHDSVEVGWGDRAFYMAREAGSGLALRAALWPSASVLHVQGFSGRAGERFPASEIVEVRLSRRGFDRLCAFFRENYAHGAGGAAVPLGPGQEPESRFYLGSRKYHLFRTCNVWTAQALRAAGCPLRPRVAFTRDGVMKQIRRIGRVVQEGIESRSCGRGPARGAGASVPRSQPGFGHPRARASDWIPSRASLPRDPPRTRTCPDPSARPARAPGTTS